MKPQKDIITPTAAARRLGLHVSTIYRLILHGKLPARRVGGCRYLLRAEDVRLFAEGAIVVPVVPLQWSRHDEGGAA